MGTTLYYLTVLVEAALGVFGFRGLYEQPPYQVIGHLPHGIELRDYGSRVAAETDDDRDDGAAFNRLFGYITGRNSTGANISMTVPVARRGELIAMTVPVQSATQGGVMRFFLPRGVVTRGAPTPLDPGVRIVTVAPERLAVLRFSGVLTRSRVAAREQRLLEALATGKREPAGTPFLLTYDAPFTIPGLRRNEVAVALTR